jgi:hypothetical protein
MRHWGLAVANAAFLAPLALFAQHTSPPAPSHASATVSHISSTPSAGIHGSGSASSRTHGAASSTGTPGSRTGARTTRASQASSVKDKEPTKSLVKSSSERHGLFSFLRRHQPVQADMRNKRKRGRVSASNSIAPTQRAAVAPTEARLGCTVVPVDKPGVPCNALSPCCP